MNYLKSLKPPIILTRYVLPALGVLIVVMAITNPPPAMYLDYATMRMAIDVKEGLCKGVNPGNILGGAGDLLKGLCRTGIDAQRGKIRDYLTNATMRRNWVLFSVYETDVFDRKYVTLGLFGNFLTSTKKL